MSSVIFQEWCKFSGNPANPSYNLSPTVQLVYSCALFIGVLCAVPVSSKSRLWYCTDCRLHWAARWTHEEEEPRIKPLIPVPEATALLCPSVKQVGKNGPSPGLLSQPHKGTTNGQPGEIVVAGVTPAETHALNAVVQRLPCVVPRCPRPALNGEPQTGQHDEHAMVV